eukprot:2863451-Rhodomonas_salina.1
MTRSNMYPVPGYPGMALTASNPLLFLELDLRVPGYQTGYPGTGTGYRVTSVIVTNRIGSDSELLTYWRTPVLVLATLKHGTSRRAVLSTRY